MVAAKEWNKTNTKDDKCFSLTTCLSKLEKNENSVLATVQGGGSNRTQTCTNTKGRDPNKSCVEGLNNIEYWRVRKSKDKITTHGQEMYCLPNHIMEGKFNGMYMNHPANKHDELSKKKQKMENP